MRARAVRGVHGVEDGGRRTWRQAQQALLIGGHQQFITHLRGCDHDVPVLGRGQVVDGAHQVDGLGAGLLRLGGDNQLGISARTKPV